MCHVVPGDEHQAVGLQLRVEHDVLGLRQGQQQMDGIAHLAGHVDNARLLLNAAIQLG